MVDRTFLSSPGQRAVIVAACHQNQLFLRDLLPTLGPCAYPVWVMIGNARQAPPEWLEAVAAQLDEARHDRIIGIYRNSFISGTIQAVLDMTDLEEFLLLYDTCLVKNTAFISDVFVKHAGKSVALSPHFMMQLGKFRRPTLIKVPPPYVTNARDDCSKGELDWTGRYIKEAGSSYVQLWDNFWDTDRFDWKHGRCNMILENDYLIKYKHRWELGMVK